MVTYSLRDNKTVSSSISKQTRKPEVMLCFLLQMQSEVVEEIIYGLESGILFGYVDVLNCLYSYLAFTVYAKCLTWALLKWFWRCIAETLVFCVFCSMASVISKMGFLFLNQGFSAMILPVCMSISISCSATGFVYQVCSNLIVDTKFVFYIKFWRKKWTAQNRKYAMKLL